MDKIGSILGQGAVKNTMAKIQRMSKSLSPDEQLQLSKQLANLPLTKDTSNVKARKAGKSGEYIQQEAQGDRVQKTLEKPSITNALDRLETIVTRFTPEEQKELVQMLSQRFLTKSAGVTKATTAARKGEFFEAADKKQAPKGKDKEEAPKETSAEQAANDVLNHQTFKVLTSALSREANAKKRAEIAIRIIKKFPRQTDKFNYFIYNLLK